MRFTQFRARVLAPLMCSVTLLVAPVATAEMEKERPLASTQYGDVRGAVDDGISVFLGIPYGGDTAGERFKPAGPPAPWGEALEATAFPDSTPAVEMSSAMFASWAPDPAPAQSENMLGLNVWTPGLDDRQRPVMVWLHGGGFQSGNGSSNAYNGTALAQRGDVVVVTINHRLNMLGYLYLADIGGEAYADSGNLGNMDMVLALEWVRDNIAEFGGNPNNVTIFGESGGGRKVSTLLAMPSAEGLIDRAIVQSGSHLKIRTPEEATEDTREIMALLGIEGDDVAALEALSVEEIVDAVKQIGLNMTGSISWGPVLDGRTFTSHPFDGEAAASARNVPMLIGSNKDELSLWIAPDRSVFTMDYDEVAPRLKAFVSGDVDIPALVEGYRAQYPEKSPAELMIAVASDARYSANAVTQAKVKAAQGGAPVWLYQFDWETPVFGGVLGAPHAVEIPFAFDNLDVSASMVGDPAKAQGVADQVSEAWISFARHGNPNARGLPYWPRVSATRPTAMRFDDVSKVDPAYFAEEQAIWDRLDAE